MGSRKEGEKGDGSDKSLSKYFPDMCSLFRHFFFLPVHASVALVVLIAILWRFHAGKWPGNDIKNMPMRKKVRVKISDPSRKVGKNKGSLL